jgi:hypothetical protein
MSLRVKPGGTQVELLTDTGGMIARRIRRPGRASDSRQSRRDGRGQAYAFLSTTLGLVGPADDAAVEAPDDAEVAPVDGDDAVAVV